MKVKGETELDGFKSEVLAPAVKADVDDVQQQAR